MTGYSELVNALRSASTVSTAWEKLMLDSAAAIEELQAEVKILKVSGREAYFEGLAADAEPKRGEWIRHPEVKNIYGGEYIECPFCGEKYVVQYIADEKFCRNCGADMRKMEVQE